MDLGEVGELAKDVLVSQRNEVEAVMGQSAQRSDRSRLLTTTGAGSRDEKAGVLAVVTTGGPLLASRVPESLPLGREVTVTGRDTEENTIVF